MTIQFNLKKFCKKINRLVKGKAIAYMVKRLGKG